MKLAGIFKGKIEELNVEVRVYKKTVILDLETPAGIFERLKPISYCLLESADARTRFGQNSFICGYPLITLSYHDGVHTFSADNRRIEIRNSDPLSILNELTNIQSEERPEFKGLFAGFVGYLSYDAYRYYEPRSTIISYKTEHPEAFFIFPSFVISYSHLTHISEIFVSELFMDGEKIGHQSAGELFKLIEGKIVSAAGPLPEYSQSIFTESFSRARSTFTEEGFKKAVRKAKEYIYSGDAYQIVISQRIDYPVTISPFKLYRYLRINNPSPYMFYYPAGSVVLVGASPEPLIKVTGRTALTRPIAGTRKRGIDDHEDMLLSEELLNDRKELAEHTMLVDLGRNDLGRIGKKGSVEVVRKFEVEKYSHVMHIVSEVKCTIDEKYSSIDALKAVFPAGTVSGAPKIRAAQIISELEPVNREIYAGAFGYVSLTSDLDFCIVIRTAFITEKFITVQAGAGIVRDSDPQAEYEETLNKAKGILEILDRGLTNNAAVYR